MSQRMAAPDFNDGRTAHGVEACLDLARGRSRVTTAGGEKLARKLRLPKGDRWIARIARQERQEVEAEVRGRLEGRQPTAFHWHSIDRVYFATCGILRGYSYLEKLGYYRVADNGPEAYPVVDTITRLQRIKSEALKDLGLDRPADAIDVWATVLSPAQPRHEPNADGSGQSIDQASQDVADRT